MRIEPMHRSKRLYFFLVNQGMGMASTKVLGSDREALENKRRKVVLQNGIKSELLETDARPRH